MRHGNALQRVSLRFAQQRFDFRQQYRDFLVDGAPDDAVIDEVVSVRQHVPEVDDAPVLGDAARGAGIMQGEPVHGLADDLESALDRLPQQPFAPLVLQRLAGRDLANEGRSVPDVLKQLGGLRLHRRPAASC